MPLSGSGTWFDFAPSTQRCASRFSNFQNLAVDRFRFSQNSKTSGGVGRCQGVRTGLVSVLGAWLPSFLWVESITTPFGFLGAVAIQSTKTARSDYLSTATL